jgi:hypothetical protein
MPQIFAAKIVVHHDTAWWPMRFRIPAYVHGVVPTSNVCTPNAGTSPYAFEPSPDKHRLPMVFSRLREPTYAWGTQGFVWAVAFRERNA